MTANQIAAASVSEEKRHNAVYEEETKRHNTETERIQDRINDITQTYNTQKVELEKWYNEKYIEYLNASLEQKQAIESELNNIKEQQMISDREYKEQMAMYQDRLSASESQYKNALTNLTEMDVALREKQAYYETQKTEAYLWNITETLRLTEKKINAEIDRINKEYELGLINNETRIKQIEVQNKQLELAREKWSTEKENIQSQTKLNDQNRIKSGVNAATDIINSASNLVDSILPF